MVTCMVPALIAARLGLLIQTTQGLVELLLSEVAVTCDHGQVGVDVCFDRFAVDKVVTSVIAAQQLWQLLQMHSGS